MRMTTHSGTVVSLTDPNPADLLLSDIAHHLGNICRFSGATERHYSVAEHSVYVSYLVPREHAWDALMHDAPETWLNDVITPVKEGAEMQAYRAMEHGFHVVLAEKFGLALHPDPCVKVADLQAYLKERIELIPAISPWDDGEHDDPIYQEIEIPTLPLPLSDCTLRTEGSAKRIFIKRYNELRYNL